MIIEESVNNIKFMSKMMESYSFPSVSPHEELIVSPIKQREVVIDGYEVYLFFNRCKYTNVILETAQIYGRYCSFLPFDLVIKTSRLFFGEVIPAYASSLNNLDLVHSLRKTYMLMTYKDLKDNYLNYEDYPIETVPGIKEHQGFKFVEIKKEKMVFF